MYTHYPLDLIYTTMKSLLRIFILGLSLAACQEDSAIAPEETPSEPSLVVRADSTYGFSLTRDIPYAEGLSHDTLNSPSSTRMELKLDAYIPDNEDEKRPAILLIHGGGFVGGDKDGNNMPVFARYFAARGWAAFSINYRLKRDRGTVPDAWYQFSLDSLADSHRGTFNAIYPAHRDAKAALRWLFANAATYNIDTNYITVGGGSAGAITSISLGISEPGDFRDEISPSLDPTLATSNPEQPYTIHTLLDFWGSGLGIDLLENVYGHQRFGSNDPPIMIVHGTEDPTVPFEGAETLRAQYIQNGIDHEFYPLEGLGHGPWNATVNGKRLEELSFDFIVEQQNITVE